MMVSLKISWAIFGIAVGLAYKLIAKGCLEIHFLSLSQESSI
jgi:hypothetical protein